MLDRKNLQTLLASNASDSEVLSAFADAIHQHDQHGVLVLRSPQYNIDILRAINTHFANVCDNLDEPEAADKLRTELHRCAAYIQEGDLIPHTPESRHVIARDLPVGESIVIPHSLHADWFRTIESLRQRKRGRWSLRRNFDGHPKRYVDKSTLTYTLTRIA